MKLKNIKQYEDWKNKNTDFYGACCFKYAERWAELMELKINQGYKIKDIAEGTSHKTDIEGVTGFMYAMTVNILTQCWKYGEELRKWHNKKYQYEGNGVVNPSILIINKERM